MKDIQNATEKLIMESAETKYQMLPQADIIAQIAEKAIETLKAGRKIILFGNGGSAADAQHIAAEIVGSFSIRKRRALPAIALNTNTSNLTAIANDYGYENTFSRQVEALAQKGDLIIAISTSGNAPNVIKAVKTARQRSAFIVGFTGNTQNKLKALTHLCFSAPSSITARIQECHITAGHIICEMIDRSF